MSDPQTQLQEDKDPMLILHSSYLDSGGDLHPDGDLGTGLCHLFLLLGGTRCALEVTFGLCFNLPWQTG